jgi:hypothetical protein
MDADTLLRNTVERLLRHKGSYAEIARQNEQIGHSWLTKLAQGQITNPTVQSLQQLIEALNAFEGIPPVPSPAPTPTAPAAVDPDAGRIEPVEIP